MYLECEELELRKGKVLDGAGGSVRECPGAAGEDVRMAAGHSQELCCAVGKVPACGVCLGKLSAPWGWNCLLYT